MSVRIEGSLPGYWVGASQLHLRPRMPRFTLILGVCSVLLAGCSEAPIAVQDVPPVPDRTVATPPRESIPPVVRLEPIAAERAGLSVEAVRQVAATRVLKVEGRVAENQERTVTVGSFTEGIVVESYVFEGSSVAEGQVLARIHSYELHEVEAEYRKARADLQRRQAELDYARQAQQRAERLHQLKAGTLQQLQQTQTALQAARSAVTMAEAEIESARIHLSYLGVEPEDIHHSAAQPDDRGEDPLHLVQVRSPIRGTVIARNITKGGVVAAAAPLYTISDLSRLWVIAQVPEEHLGLVKKGMPVQIQVRAYPGESFPGKVLWVGDSLDRHTRTLQVRCQVGNSQRRLKLEMYATLLIRADQGESAIVVPPAAVQVVDTTSVVFVQVADHSFQPRLVEPGRQLAQGLEIVAGVEKGELVAVAGAFVLKSELLKDRMIEEE